MSTFALILVVLWLLGSISSFTVGGFIHVFLALAIGMMLPRIIAGAGRRMLNLRSTALAVLLEFAVRHEAHRLPLQVRAM